MKTHRSLLSGLILMLLAACSPKVTELPEFPQRLMPEKTEALCNKLYTLDSKNFRRSWKGAVPIRFKLDPRVPADWVPEIQTAMDLWNKAAGTTLFELHGYRSDASGPAEDGQNTIYVLEDKISTAPVRDAMFSSLSNDKLAFALTYSKRNKIYESDIAFDGVTHPYSSWRVRLNSFDIQTIAMHELGHALGLDHNNDELLSTMSNGDLPFGYALRRVDDTSKLMLTCEY